MKPQTPKWLDWAQEIFSLSQSGLTYSGNQYDIERYKRLQEITAEIIANQSEISRETVLEGVSMQAGYITPKIDVRGAVIRDNKILLIQARADGKWAVVDAIGSEPMEFYHADKLIFFCTLLDGEPRISYDTLAIDSFDPARLPSLSIYRPNKTMIQAVFAHVEDPSRWTAFD